MNDKGGNQDQPVDDFILKTDKLVKKFADFTAVDQVNLHIRRNTIHALIGPNGAGKTTVFNLLTKVHTPTSGEIWLNGENVTSLSTAALALKGMVRSFQISSIFPHLTVLENVRIALQRDTGKSMHFWSSMSVLNALNEKADEYIESVGLQEERNRLATDLSYGRKRALELVTTLALEPEMLLLDEPLAGMGHEDIDRTSELIRRISKDRTILMVEHNLSVVADLSDHVTVMTRGKVLTEGSYEEVSNNRDVREAYIGGVDA